MKIQRFEDLIVWKKSIQLSIYVYKLSKNINDKAFENQIQRAVISISNNIAEGFERNSKKESIYFLNIAKGSAKEVRSMLYIAKHLKYCSEYEFKILYSKIIEISKMLSGMMKAQKNKLT